MGCTENGLKKRLAYSSISQISYVLLGVFLMTPVGLLGGLLQLLFHALAKIGVFQSAGSIIFLTGTETIDGFPGLGRRIPVTMGCFAALALSLVGIPPFGGFFSKWYLERLTVCLTVIAHLRARKETRWHSFAENLDYPEKSDAWLCYVNSKKNGDQITMIRRDLVKGGETYEHRD